MRSLCPDFAACACARSAGAGRCGTSARRVRPRRRWARCCVVYRAPAAPHRHRTGIAPACRHRIVAPHRTAPARPGRGPAAAPAGTAARPHRGTRGVFRDEAASPMWSNSEPRPPRRAERQNPINHGRRSCLAGCAIEASRMGGDAASRCRAGPLPRHAALAARVAGVRIVMLDAVSSADAHAARRRASASYKVDIEATPRSLRKLLEAHLDLSRFAKRADISERPVRFSDHRHPAAGARSGRDAGLFLAGRAHRRAYRRRPQAGHGERRSRPADHHLVDFAVVPRAGADRRPGQENATRFAFSLHEGDPFTQGELGQREKCIAARRCRRAAIWARRSTTPRRASIRARTTRNCRSPTIAARPSRWASSTCRARGAIRSASSTTSTRSRRAKSTTCSASPNCSGNCRTRRTTRAWRSTWTTIRTNRSIRPYT